MTDETRNAPALSIILPTDTGKTIEPVLHALRRQTLASRLEVLLVTTSPDDVAETARKESAFHAVRVVAVEALAPMGVARVAGIRAATSPLIFVGETHSFLHPDAARLLVAAADGPWTAIAPGFENVNPTGALSWSAFLADYSRWTALSPGGEIQEAPIYDCLYRRDALLAMGDHLVSMLSFGDDLRRTMEERGHRVLFFPTARIGHVNLEAPWAWFHEHFLVGVLIGGRRARQWPWTRRLVYVAGAGLIPAVLLWRVWPSARRVARAHRLPAGTWGLLALLYVAKAAGEVLGYLGGGTPQQEATMGLYEIHRFDYVSQSTRRAERHLSMWESG